METKQHDDSLYEQSLPASVFQIYSIEWGATRTGFLGLLGNQRSKHQSYGVSFEDSHGARQVVDTPYADPYNIERFSSNFALWYFRSFVLPLKKNLCTIHDNLYFSFQNTDCDRVASLRSTGRVSSLTRREQKIFLDIVPKDLFKLGRFVHDRVLQGRSLEDVLQRVKGERTLSESAISFLS